MQPQQLFIQFIMKKKYFLIPLLVLIIGFSREKASAQWQFTITEMTDSASVVQLVKDVFLDGVSPSQYQNVTFKGDPRSVGYFTNGYFIGFDRPQGIVMSTGFAGNLDKDNSCSTFENGNTSGGSDPDLVTANNGGSINDACVIEFDFKPAGDSVKFNYIFGSEEYHEWVSPLFADVFGFFLSGPGINGDYTNNGINIAEVPGTHQPVSIGTVNCGDQDADCTPPPGGGPNCQFLYDNTNSAQGTFYQTTLDAYTVPFVADNGVQSCSWYHMKLAVGDAGDAAYDTGVYLEKGSFDPGKVTEETVYSHPTIDSILYESCNNHEAVLYFGIGSYRNSVYKLPYTVIGTATRNVDYSIQSTHAGDTIYIPVGRLYDSLIIRTFADGIDEGIESIGIRYNPVMCGFGNPDTAFVYISDLIPMVDTALYYFMYCQDTVTLGFSGVAGGVPPYSFDWYTLNKKTATVDFIPNGDDNFLIPCVVYDTCGQQISDTAIIIVPDLLTDAGPDQDMCNQPSAQLSGSAPGAQAFWWTSAPTDPSLVGQEALSNPVVSPAVTTAYTLTASDNCTNSDDDVTQILLDGASANAGPDELICINESVDLSCNLGSSGETYTWTSVPVDPSLSGQEDQQTITVSPTVTTVYTVNLINDCGYTATDDVEVEVTPLPIASAGPDDNICFGQTYQLNASGGSHFQWSSVPNDPSLFVNGQDTLANPIVTPPTQVPYTYTVQVWDMCANTASMTLSVDPVPNITVSADNPTSCYGSPVVISAGGTPANYIWTANPADPTLSGQENNQVITVSPLVTTTYTLVGVVAGFSCPATVEQTIVVKPELFATFETQASTICENAPFTVLYTGNASPSATYTWDFDGATVLNGTGAGPYDVSWTGMGAKNITLTVNDAGCLSEPYSSGLSVLQSPAAAFSADIQEGCAPYEVQFTNNSSNQSSSVTYNWNFGVSSGTSTQASPSFTYTTPSSYTVSLTVTNDGQCSDQLTETGFITVNDTPISEFTPNPTETLLEDATINFINTSSSLDNLNYDWDFGDGGTSTEFSPNHTYTAQGTFTVELIAKTEAGCEHISTQEVTVFPNFAVYAPSAFTPNGDEKNETFEVKGIGIKNYHLQVYSRWGELIYESFNLEEMWDGKVNGTLVESGTYAFLINYQSMLGKDADVKGTVTVMY